MPNKSDSDRQKRLNYLVQFLNDTAITLTDKERLETVYHAVAYEILTYRAERLLRRRNKHGKFMNDQMVYAKFMHQLQDL